MTYVDLGAVQGNRCLLSRASIEILHAELTCSTLFSLSMDCFHVTKMLEGLSECLGNWPSHHGCRIVRNMDDDFQLTLERHQHRWRPWHCADHGVDVQVAKELNIPVAIHLGNSVGCNLGIAEVGKGDGDTSGGE